jgi:hypothetical protein
MNSDDIATLWYLKKIRKMVVQYLEHLQESLKKWIAKILMELATVLIIVLGQLLGVIIVLRQLVCCRRA